MADTTTSEAHERWRLVVVPLFVVMTVGLLALGVTMMRRRYGPNGFGPVGGPHDHHYRGGGNSNSRLDPSYYYSYRRPGPGVPMTGRRRRGAHHPYVGLDDDGSPDLEAGGRGRQQQQVGAAGYHGSRRREEGLNELGEAPPPYVGSGEGKKGGEVGGAPRPASAADGGSGVEASPPLREPPPGGDGATAAPAAAASSLPPAYSEARRA